MMGLLYKALYFAGFVTSLFFLPFSKKIRQGLSGRIGLTKRLKENLSEGGRPLWIHLCSSGELEQAIPIMERLKEQGRRVFLSYYSPTAQRAIALEAERRREWGKPLPWDYSDYAPLDFRGAVRRYLDALEPLRLICISKEIWPHLIEEAKARGIECHLFVAHFAPQHRKTLWWLRSWLNRFDSIGTTDESSAQMLRTFLNGPKICTVGDPRMERVLERKLHHKTFALASYFENQKVLVLGSLWPQEWPKLAPMVEAIFSEWRIVIAPHQPNPKWSSQLRRWFLQRQHSIKTLSEFTQTPERESDLVVDSVGHLAELYQIATAVFIGGSFKDKVHNVLEPAAYAKPVLTGPLIANSREAIALEKLGGLQVGYNAAQLTGFLCDISKLSDRGQRCAQYLHTTYSPSLGYTNLLS